MTTTDDNIARAKACGAIIFHAFGTGIVTYRLTGDQLDAYTAQSIADAQQSGDAVDAQKHNVLFDTLKNIADANPRNWDAPCNDTASFYAWAQSRARAAIAAQGEKE